MIALYRQDRSTQATFPATVAARCAAVSWWRFPASFSSAAGQLAIKHHLSDLNACSAAHHGLPKHHRRIAWLSSVHDSHPAHRCLPPLEAIELQGRASVGLPTKTTAMAESDQAPRHACVSLSLSAAAGRAAHFFCLLTRCINRPEKRTKRNLRGKTKWRRKGNCKLSLRASGLHRSLHQRQRGRSTSKGGSPGRSFRHQVPAGQLEEGFGRSSQGNRGCRRHHHVSCGKRRC